MIAADSSERRSRDARLLVVDARGRIRDASRSAFVDFLRTGDLVVANDAATLPASLHGVHLPSGRPIEIRLASRRSLHGEEVREFTAVVFGAGDFRTRTEDRPPPPLLAPGDRLTLGPLAATVADVLGHPRLVLLRFEGSANAIWAGLARHGRPIQYAHVPAALALWDVWTRVAAAPVAFEPPSAGFVLDWKTIATMRERRIAYATITLAAGISSTGDSELDRRLPLDEAYRIPGTTAEAIHEAKADGRRVIAIGTTVVRALEHSAARSGRVCAGHGVATQRMDATTELRVVDAILSGVHEPDTGHYQVLRAFADDATLRHASRALEMHGYRTHEFGDSVLIERTARGLAGSQGTRLCTLDAAASCCLRSSVPGGGGPSPRDTQRNGRRRPGPAAGIPLRLRLLRGVLQGP